MRVKMGETAGNLDWPGALYATADGLRSTDPPT